MEDLESGPGQSTAEKLKRFYTNIGERTLKFLRGPDSQELIRKRIEKNKAAGRDPLHGFRRFGGVETSFHPYPARPNPNEKDGEQQLK